MAHYRFRFGGNRRTGWGAKYLEIMATKYDSPPMYVAIGLLLLCMYGLIKDINKINAAIAGVIYLFLLSLVAIVVASLVPVYAIIIVFSTAGAMFLISMLAGLLFNIDPGSHRFYDYDDVDRVGPGNHRECRINE